MKKVFMLVLLIIFLFGLGGCGNNRKENQDVAKNGELNLVKHNFNEIKIVELRGEWEFYWNKLLVPSDFSQIQSFSHSNVPKIWNKIYISNKMLHPDGYATYRLRLQLPSQQIEYGIVVPEQAEAYKLWLDGVLVASNGIVGTNRQTTHPGGCSQIVPYQHSGDKPTELVIQIANYHLPSGGFWQPIQIGAAENIQFQSRIALGIDAFMFGMLFVMGIYHLGLFLIRRREYAVLFFSLFCLLLSLYIIVEGEHIIFQLLPNIPLAYQYRIEYISIYLAIPLFFSLIGYLFPNKIHTSVLSSVWIIGFLFTIFTLMTNMKVFSINLYVIPILMLIVSSYILFVFIKDIIRKDWAMVPVFIAIFILVASAMIDMFSAPFQISRHKFFPIGLLCFVLFIAWMIYKRFSSTYIQAESVQKTLEESLLKAEEINKLHKQYMSTATHELRTPMAVIQASVELIQNYGEKMGEDKKHEYLDRIQDSVVQMSRLMNDLFLSGNKQGFDFSFNAECFDVIQKISENIEKTRIAMNVDNELSYHYSGNCRYFHGDKTLLELISGNLLSNAIKYSPNNTPIEFYLRCNEKNVIFTIKDYGIGISEESLKKVWEPFNRGDNVGQIRGTGIGLSVVKKAVDVWGGTIELVSDPGKGSVFTVTLPDRIDLIKN